MALKRWYVLHTYSQHEEKVKKKIEDIAINNGLSDEIGEIYLPKKRIVEIDKNGKSREKFKIVTPGYLYVNVCLNDRVWHMIRGIDGVTGFLGDPPNPIKKSIIDKIKDSLVEKTNTVCAWKKGDNVIIKSGSFTDFEGVVDSVSDRKVRVIINLFDRPTPVDLDFNQIELY